jgi:hypothetical protein
MCTLKQLAEGPSKPSGAASFERRALLTMSHASEGFLAHPLVVL